jgi:hypothetical protein
MEKNVLDVLSLDSGLYDGLDDYESIFCALARYLMNGFILMVDKDKYQISEIEFYLKDGVHDDPFIHGDPHQGRVGRWYFHRQNGKGYKSGSFKGVDVTFGYKSNKRKFYGGILIRSIYDLNKHTIIEGPCNVVNTVLAKTKKATIDELVTYGIKKNGQSLTDETMAVNMGDLLYLTYDTNGELHDSSIFSGPRVGLTLKVYSKEREGYLMNDYRYINRITDVKNFRSGMVLSMIGSGMTVDEIVAKTGVSASNINKYVEYYENKDAAKAVDFTGMKLSVKDLCILQKVCQKIHPKIVK